MTMRSSRARRWRFDITAVAVEDVLHVCGSIVRNSFAPLADDDEGHKSKCWAIQQLDIGCGERPTRKVANVVSSDRE